MKDIVIIADFLGSLDGTYNSRFLYLADMLVKNNMVEIVTSDFDHGSKSYFNHEIERHEYPITLLHEASYPKNVCLRRFYGHYTWGKNVKEYLKTRKKPDVVFCAVPTLKASYEVAKFCEKNKIRFIVDIQDLWPETFQMAFNIPILSDIAFLPFTFIVNAIYKSADSICAVSDTFCKRALKVNKKCKKSTTVFLGTDLDTFDKYASNEPILEKKKNEIWLGYAGSLSESYNLPIVFEAMRKINYPFLRFIVMGDGASKSTFEDKAKGLNVIFTGRLPYDQMCSMLSVCDMVINPIVDSSVASIINKHADYAACGKPIINTQRSKEYRKLIKDYKMGINCNNSDVEKLAKGISILIDNENLRLRMGKNARKCAEKLFDRKKSYRAITDLFIEGERN